LHRTSFEGIPSTPGGNEGSGVTVTAEQAGTVYAEAELLYPVKEVEAALDRMADTITARLKGCDPLLLSVLIGGLVPTAKLLARLQFPLQLDYIHATRYRGGTRGGELQWIAKPQTLLQNRVVLVIDDILDEGHTLTAILRYCQEKGAREVLIAVLVDKVHDRKYEGIRTSFRGLEVSDRYVFGYGMDYQGYLRNAPGIFAVKGM
jgi:Hypoxanthine-guanine phosphoribosyltransferase